MHLQCECTRAPNDTAMNCANATKAGCHSQGTARLHKPVAHKVAVPRKDSADKPLGGAHLCKAANKVSRQQLQLNPRDNYSRALQIGGQIKSRTHGMNHEGQVISDALAHSGDITNHQSALGQGSKITGSNGE